MEIVVVEVCEPSTVPRSSTPAAVMVCGASQFAGVNVIESRSTVTSFRFEDWIERTTFVFGLAVKTIVKVSVVPDSSTSVDPSVSATVNQAMSTSRVPI